MTEVIKGYIMQALFYYVVGDPFCDNHQCRLFNAHWQEDLIRAQLKTDADCHSEFCSLHQKVVKDIARRL